MRGKEMRRLEERRKQEGRRGNKMSRGKERKQEENRGRG